MVSSKNHKMKETLVDLKNSDLKNTDKTDPKDFNAEELRGWIIDEMTKIEAKVDSIILNFFAPEKRSEFKTILLNSSIINSGSKMKILRNIESFDNKIIDKIQSVQSIRNAFAHLPINKSVQINLKKLDEASYKVVGKPKVLSHLEIMNSSGLIKQKKIYVLIDEFLENKNNINQYLNSKEPNR